MDALEGNDTFFIQSTDPAVLAQGKSSGRENHQERLTPQGTALQKLQKQIDDNNSIAGSLRQMGVDLKKAAVADRGGK